MKMTKLLLLSLCIVHLNSAYTQDFGFLGKKNTFSVMSTGGIRVFPYLLGFAGFSSNSATYNKVTKYNENNQITQRSKIARIDFRASYMRLLNKKVSLGVEFGYEKFNLPMHMYDQEYNPSIMRSTPVFNAFNPMLVVELHSIGNSAPVGFSTSFGLGPKIFAFDYNQNYRFNSSLEMTNPYPVNESHIFALNFFVQLNYRRALNDFIAFDIGARAHTGFVIPDDLFNYSQTQNSTYSKGQLQEELFSENLSNLLSLKLGFTFMF